MEGALPSKPTEAMQKLWDRDMKYFTEDLSQEQQKAFEKFDAWCMTEDKKGPSEAAKKFQDPQLSTLAVQARLDALTKVKKSIQDMVDKLVKEKEKFTFLNSMFVPTNPCLRTIHHHLLHMQTGCTTICFSCYANPIFL